MAVIFVVYLFSIQTGYAVVNSRIKEAIGLTGPQIATIAATYAWVFAIFQFYGGALLDQLGARKVLTTSIALVTLGVFMFANAASYEMLLLAQGVLAIGSCTGFVGAGYVGGQWFGMAKFSVMFGLVQFFSAVTSAFTQNLIEISLQLMDYSQLFNGVGVFGIGLFIVAGIFIRNPKPLPQSAYSGPGGFFSNVTRKLLEVTKIPHIWVASLIAAFLFGSLLSLGIVWAPKLLQARGIDATTAYFGTSMIWLGLAVGSTLIPKWSDKIRKRKTPLIAGALVQFLALLILVYVAGLGSTTYLALCFIFGFANASHMLAYATAVDVVKPSETGTSAAIVNGITFIIAGVLISRPGIRIDRAIEKGIEAGSVDIIHYAVQPLIIAMVLAVILTLAMNETYPQKD